MKGRRSRGDHVSFVFQPKSRHAPIDRLTYVRNEVSNQNRPSIEVSVGQSTPTPTRAVELEHSGPGKGYDAAARGLARPDFLRPDGKLEGGEEFGLHRERQSGLTSLASLGTDYAHTFRLLQIIDLEHFERDYRIIEGLTAGGNELADGILPGLREQSGFCFEREFRIE